MYAGKPIGFRPPPHIPRHRHRGQDEAYERSARELQRREALMEALEFRRRHAAERKKAAAEFHHDGTLKS
jgi:hypothetical protein